MKKQYVTPLILSLILTSFNIFAQSIEFNMCKDSVAAICESTSDYRSKRKIKILNLKEEIKKEAEENIKLRQSEDQEIASTGLEGIFERLSRWISSFTIKNEEIMNSARKRISGFEEDIVSSGMIDEIKRMLKLEVNSSVLTVDQKDRFNNVIDEVVVGNFGDYIERMNLKNSIFSQIFSNLHYYPIYLYGKDL